MDAKELRDVPNRDRGTVDAHEGVAVRERQHAGRPSCREVARGELHPSIAGAGSTTPQPVEIAVTSFQDQPHRTIRAERHVADIH